MYRGFNLKLNVDDGGFVSQNVEEEFYKRGFRLYEDNRKKIETELDSYLINNSKVLDGSAMQSDWFPLVEADIFLSHSRKDEKRAISLAGMLDYVFNISVFIDSCIWGYSDELLKKIDNKYCLSEEGLLYDYEKRNASTSHVHMMLATSLSKMIDRAECLFFLNTPNALSTNNIVNKTRSPWIYHELATSKIIKTSRPLRRQINYFSNEKYLEKALSESQDSLLIDHLIDLKHLQDLDKADLWKWIGSNRSAKASGKHPLDVLYDLFPAPNKRNL